MKLPFIKISILALAISLMTLASPVWAVKGIAFVHGTGENDDALNDYWTSSVVNQISNGRPHVVVNCDFEEFAWTNAAAGCLAGYLDDFISSNNIDDLVVITHSHGGNVMRWILSNPTWDPRYPSIIATTSKVTAIAPTSLGTPLANAVVDGNVFENILGWILGYDSDAVKMQQTSWMAYYNQYWLLGTNGRPALPVYFQSVVGTDVDSSPFDGDSYCGGILNQIALEVTQNWLNSCSDGFINCTSQAGAGVVWFYDTDLTSGDEPLSHQQSRRGCFNLSNILKNNI